MIQDYTRIPVRPKESAVTRATPEELELAKFYRQIFDGEAGQRVLDDLDATFGGNPFDVQSDRVTSFRCGAAHVVAYILASIALAEAVNVQPPQETMRE